MGRTRTLALASVSTVGGLAWSGYRRAAREIGAHDPAPPNMPGVVASVAAPWGTCTYRIVEGASTEPPLMLIHGWGRTADSAWWPILPRTSRTLIALDLPGHGASTLDERFELQQAVLSVELALEHAGLSSVALVGHSLGGAVALSAGRRFTSALLRPGGDCFVRLLDATPTLGDAGGGAICDGEAFTCVDPIAPQGAARPAGGGSPHRLELLMPSTSGGEPADGRRFAPIRRP